MKLHVLRRRRLKYKRKNKAGTALYTLHKEYARALVHARLTFYNAYYGHVFNKVFIKNSRSRWGSCSIKKNLNFNYRVVHLRPELQDYLIVHELCHLAEFNHSPQFWALVSKTIPRYKELRREIRAISLR